MLDKFSKFIAAIIVLAKRPTIIGSFFRCAKVMRRNATKIQIAKYAREAEHVDRLTHPEKYHGR